MAKKTNKDLDKIAKELFENLGIEDPFEVTETDNGYEILLNATDSGIVIGRHGDTLDSLQLVLSMMLTKKTGEFKRVTLEVGDYKKNRSEYLSNLAQQTKERALSEQREVYLQNLKPWERRIIHLFLQEDDEVISESMGEGRDRVLVVKPKN